MEAHEHYCNSCHRHYECTHSACKFVFIHKCISCSLIEAQELLDSEK